MTTQGEFEQRVARLQREGDAYLLHYWDAYSSPRFAEACAAIVGALLPEAQPLGKRQPIRHFDFGCGAGALFRATDHYLSGTFEFTRFGVDADQKAPPFLKNKFPDANVTWADAVLLHQMDFAGREHFDLCTAMSVFYALSDEEVALTIGDFGRMADLVIIGDQIENLEGEKADTLTLKDADGNEYQSYCHPFGRLLRQVGFSHLCVVPAQHPVKSISGFVVASKRPLPVGLMDEVRTMARYRVFVRQSGAIPRVSVSGLGICDVNEPQLERLSEQTIRNGSVFAGGETIANFGIKIAEEVPSGGTVQIEFDDGARSEAAVWDRHPCDFEQSGFKDSEAFPAKQNAAGPWTRNQWGSWGFLHVQDGNLVYQFHASADVDANQADGMGPLELMLYSYPEADLRDATVEIEVRGHNFEPGDAQILAWFQHRRPMPNIGWYGTSANYGLTSQPLTPYLADGHWHRIALQFSNRPDRWSFAGNVFADGEGAKRFSYESLDGALGSVTNFLFLACFPKAAPNYFDKRDRRRFGERPRGAMHIRSVRFSRPPGSPRFANFDHIAAPGTTRRFRSLRTNGNGSTVAGEWREVSLPQSREPLVLRLQQMDGFVTGRVNAMGLRTWCWLQLEDRSQDSLYLGSTKHARDFYYRMREPAERSALFVVANEAGAVSFPIT